MLTACKVKRARLSDAGTQKGKGKERREATPSDHEDDDDDDEEMEDNAGNRSPPKTQYEELRDDDFRHLEHAEADDYKATQNIMRMATRAEERLGDNLVAHNGILESITCVNFMCHERLHVELGPLLNFIVGENGSGKSAILTAITLCLGGKATATNRGGSLKSFIKEGCDRASLSVKLKNQGADAYRADLYGDSIIVERSFSRTGTSGFKVKSAEGQTISTKKSEVDEVVEFYALQVDNPLNILSQDNARQFLNASSATEKYRYFIEGVQLEQLDRDYRLISEFVDNSTAKAPLQKERVDIATRDYTEAQRLNELVQDSRRLKAKRRLLGYQVCWAQVADEERKAVELEKRLKEADEEITGFEQAVDHQAEQLRQFDDAIADKRAAHSAAQEEAAHREAGVGAVKESYDEAQKQLQQMHNDERNAHSEATQAKKEVKRLEEEIVKEKAKLEANQGDEVALKRQQIEEAKAGQQEASKEAESLRNSIKEMSVQCQGSQEGLKVAKVAIDEKRREVQAIKRRIEEIVKGQGGKYDAYDRKMPLLIKAIEHDNGWREKPIGPIGSHIQILKPIWSSILEKTLGGVLNDFIVTSLTDQQRLQKHMRTVGISGPGVLIANGRHVDTTGHEPDAEFDTVLRILKFDNDVVRSQLVINASIEQILLIPNRIKAEEVMFNGRLPPNVKQCLSFHDTKRNTGLLLISKMGGKNISTNPVEPNHNQRPRMMAEQDSAMSAQKEILGVTERELHGLVEQMQNLDKEHKRNVAQIQDMTKAMRAHERRANEFQAQVESISSELDTYEGADVRLETLTTQCEEQKGKAEHFAEQYAQIRVSKEAYNREVEAKKEALAAEKAEKREFDKKVRELEADVNKYVQLRSLCLADKNALHEQLDMAKAEKRRLQGKQQDKIEHIKHFSSEASKQAPDRPHIPEHETLASLQAQYDSLTSEIREMQRQNGITDKEASELVAKTWAALKKVQKDYEVSQATIKRLKLTLDQRMNKWRLLQRFISAHARSSFAYLLRERRFRGQLLINHREKLLSLRVEPEKTEKSGQGRNTKTLSGGEKSFSSICLLLSIWEAMGAPLRCLDEFDVFMDNVNRAVSTKMLVSLEFLNLRLPSMGANLACADDCRTSVGRSTVHLYHAQRHRWQEQPGQGRQDHQVGSFSLLSTCAGLLTNYLRLGDPRQRRLADP
jgi:chromosome segregation ATPase